MTALDEKRWEAEATPAQLRQRAFEYAVYAMTDATLGGHFEFADWLKREAKRLRALADTRGEKVAA